MSLRATIVIGAMLLCPFAVAGQSSSSASASCAGEPDDKTCLLQVGKPAVASGTDRKEEKDVNAHDIDGYAQVRDMAFVDSYWFERLTATEDSAKADSTVQLGERSSSKTEIEVELSSKTGIEADSSSKTKTKEDSAVVSEEGSSSKTETEVESSSKTETEADSSSKTKTKDHSSSTTETEADSSSKTKTKACIPPNCWELNEKPEQASSTPACDNDCKDFCGWRTNVNLCIWSCKKALTAGVIQAWASSYSDPYNFGNIAKAWVRRADPVQSWWPDRGGVPQQMGGRWPSVAKIGNNWFDTQAESGMKNALKMEKFR